MNNRTAAREIFARPGHPGAINNLGVLYAKTGKMTDSIAALPYGIQINPDDETLHLNLARICVTMGERDHPRPTGGTMIFKLMVVFFLVQQALVDSVAASGRIVGLADPPSERLSAKMLLAPGAPPILSFRYFDSADRGRFGELGLMTDDAGH